MFLSNKKTIWSSVANILFSTFVLLTLLSTGINASAQAQCPDSYNFVDGKCQKLVEKSLQCPTESGWAIIGTQCVNSKKRVNQYLHLSQCLANGTVGNVLARVAVNNSDAVSNVCNDNSRASVENAVFDITDNNILSYQFCAPVSAAKGSYYYTRIRVGKTDQGNPCAGDTNFKLNPISSEGYKVISLSGINWLKTSSCLGSDGSNIMRIGGSTIDSGVVNFCAGDNTRQLTEAAQSYNISIANQPATNQCPPGSTEDAGKCKIVVPANGFIIGDSNISVLNCNGKEFSQNTVFSCIGTLSGSSNGIYFAPDSGIKIGINGEDKSNCAIQGNTLVCGNIIGKKAGKNLTLKMDIGGKIVDKGTVSIVEKTENKVVITNANGSDKSSSSVTVSDNKQSTSSLENSQSVQSNSQNKTGISITCNSGVNIIANSNAVCKFDLNGKNMPEKLNVALGDGNIEQSNCYQSETQGICINVSTGSQTGDVPLFIKLGSDEKVNTGYSLRIVNPDGTFNPNNTTLSRSGGENTMLNTITAFSIMGLGIITYFITRKKFQFHS
jgi:hypothetical protein